MHRCWDGLVRENPSPETSGNIFSLELCRTFSVRIWQTNPFRSSSSKCGMLWSCFGHYWTNVQTSKACQSRMIPNWDLLVSSSSWGYPLIAWMVFVHGKIPLQRDDNWGYPYFRKPAVVDGPKSQVGCNPSRPGASWSQTSAGFTGSEVVGKIGFGRIQRWIIVSGMNMIIFRYIGTLVA